MWEDVRDVSVLVLHLVRQHGAAGWEEHLSGAAARLTAPVRSSHVALCGSFSSPVMGTIRPYLTGLLGGMGKPSACKDCGARHRGSTPGGVCVSVCDVVGYICVNIDNLCNVHVHTCVAFLFRL